MKRPNSGIRGGILILLFFAFFEPKTADGQGIRKHYTQLTESERVAFIEAVDFLLYSGILPDYADIHTDPDQDGIPGNTTSSSTDSDSPIHRVSLFLPWHRQFLAEFERELQAYNPKLTIPYWDWTGELDPSGVNSRSSVGPLWSSSQAAELGWNGSLIGKYDNTNILGRRLSGVLPSVFNKNSLLSSSSFFSYGNFRNELERNLHDPPHTWVGGQMGMTTTSPRDPVFFIHHAMVDYLWQLWTEQGHSISFNETSMPTFDGDVAGFDRVDPDDIRNSVTQMGIFYATPEMSYVELHDYTVENDRVPNENFVYPDEIRVDGSFGFASDAVAEIHSCDKVVLMPGVTIPAGSSVRIGTEGFCETEVVSATVADNTEETSLEDTFPTEEETFLPADIQTEAIPVRESVSLKGYPNPFKESFTFHFNLPEEQAVSLTLVDALGKTVASPMPLQRRSQGEHQLLVDAQDLPSGIYSAVLLCHDTNERYVLRVVKSR